MTHSANGNRSELWLSLLRRLTERFPTWAVWKNVESALSGHGDIDSFASPEEWDSIEAEFHSWASRNGFGPIVVCRHIPQGPHFVTLDPNSPYLLQLDVKERATFRGATLMRVQDLLELAELDERGFRRIRPGAEGVLKLVYNGLRHGGRFNPEGLRTKGAVDLLRQDPEGMYKAARLFGAAEGALVRSAESVLQGEWNRSAMLLVETNALLKAITEPRVLAGRTWLNLVAKRQCPVLRVIRQNDRHVPEDRAGWLREVASSHTVDAASPPPT